MAKVFGDTYYNDPSDTDAGISKVKKPKFSDDEFVDQGHREPSPNRFENRRRPCLAFTTESKTSAPAAETFTICS